MEIVTDKVMTVTKVGVVFISTKFVSSAVWQKNYGGGEIGEGGIAMRGNHGKR